MAEIKILPPKLKVDINTEVRLRVLAGVLYELTEACGVHIEEAISKGVVERDIIQEIIISFQDSQEVSHGRICFMIDWDQFELVVKTDHSSKVYEGIDFSKGYCNALDKKVMDVLQVHVRELRKVYDIKEAKCSFQYRHKYIRTEEIHDAAREYMGHVKGKRQVVVADKEFKRSLETIFKGLDRVLRVKFEFD